MTDVSPAPTAPTPAAAVPGKTLGIVALVLAIFFGLIGAIVGFVARSQSKKAGAKNGPAVAAIIIGLIITVLWIVIGVSIGIGAAAVVGGLNQVCAELGSGVWDVNGVTYTCP